MMLSFPTGSTGGVLQNGPEVAGYKGDITSGILCIIFISLSLFLIIIYLAISGCHWETFKICLFPSRQKTNKMQFYLGSNFFPPHLGLKKNIWNERVNVRRPGTEKEPDSRMYMRVFLSLGTRRKRHPPSFRRFLYAHITYRVEIS